MKKSTVDLSIVIPCYNEEKNLPLIVKRFNKIKPKDINFELILVDNGSTDNSNKIIKSFGKKISFITLVQVKKNVGYGNGIWAGITMAKGDYICWTHADMQTDLYDTIKAYDLIKKQNLPNKCFIKGKRKGRPLFDQVFTLGMSFFETVFLGTTLYEINAQPNLFHKSFLDKIGDPPKDFSFDLYFYYMAKKLKYKIIRFPVLFPERVYGTSHWNMSLKGKYKFIKRTVKFSLELKRRLK